MLIAQLMNQLPPRAFRVAARLLVACLVACVSFPGQGAEAFSLTPTVDLKLETPRCPPFYIIGATECGVGDLASYVKSGLALPGRMVVRSAHIFDQHRARALLKARSFSETVDVTSSYLRNAHAPLRMKAFCDFQRSPKFIVTLCDPVNRTWNHFVREEAFDQANRPKYFAEGRRKLSPRTVVESYRKCVKETVPLLQDCLSINTYQECQEVLYGYVNPGAGNDALGTGKPCAGVVLSSLYDMQLEAWSREFPAQDMLTIDMSDWEQEPDEVLTLISDHFGIPRKSEKPMRIRVRKDAIFRRFESVRQPDDALATLATFFDKWQEWRHRTDWGRSAAQMSRRVAKSLARKRLLPLITRGSEGEGKVKRPLSREAWADFRDMLNSQEFSFSQIH